MNNTKPAFILICALTILATACINVEKVFQNKTRNKRITNSPEVNQMIGDSDIKLQVISERSFNLAALNKTILPVTHPKTMRLLDTLPQSRAAESIRSDTQPSAVQKESLLVGLPIGLIGEQNVFGGVITKITDTEDESLGTLKLSDLSPIHVRTYITGISTGSPAITLVGCATACTENSAHQGLINLPVVGLNEEAKMLVVDMSALGKELDLITMMDPKGDYTKLKAISSDTTAVEYDLKTLIFDIQTKMIPIDADPSDSNLKTTDFTVRWYLKLGSGFNPAFISRDETSGVGFFTTERSAAPKISRFSTTGDGSAAPVKYFIKNVPKEFQKHFAKAINSWNTEFRDIIGRDLISYEFIDSNHPNADSLVPGDIRYNIIEWDLVNKAGYGGLGPHIANQFTGEIISANVLIQGPTIVKLYSAWFNVSQKANKYLAMGKTAKANKLMKDFNLTVNEEINGRTKKSFKLKLGKHLQMNIPAQDNKLSDPLKKGHFEIVPDGVTFETYMEGYMVEILAHELGHNLGLRHNFKGNLGATEKEAEEVSVSRSVMEYLGRPYRHLNVIGSYDRMAIKYGYIGEAPEILDWFCTDEDQGTSPLSLSIKSPECTKNDATNDPYSFWENRLQRVLDLVVETNSDEAPSWTNDEVMDQITEAVIGLSAYALSAKATADSWTNFFDKEDRPQNKSEVQNYVLQSFKKKLCNPELERIISAKISADAQKLAQDNLNNLSLIISSQTKQLGLFNAEDLKCEN